MSGWKAGRLGGWEAILCVLAACGGATVKAPTAKLDWTKAKVDWTQPPKAGPEPTFAPPVPETFTLDNGVQVLLVENDRLPLVSVRVVMSRAGGREDGAKLGLASFTADLLDEGAGDLDALALPAAVEKLGARLDTSVGEDGAEIWLDTLSSTLDDSLALLADVITRPRFDAKDVDRVRADTLEQLRLRPQEPRRVANLVFDHVTFGAHPYGEPIGGEADTVGKLTRQDVVDFWTQHYVPSSATVIVAGAVDRETLEALLDQHLGSWKGKALAPIAAPALPAPDAPAIAFVDRPGAPQSVVMIGRRGPSVDDPDFFAEEVVNTAIGGSFASRLNHRIREELGYTYGISSGFFRGGWAGSWATSTSLETSVTGAGIQEALKILDDARANPLPAAELEKTQLLLTRAMPQDFESDAQVAGAFASLVTDGRPLDWYQRYAAGIRAVTADDARARADAAWKDLSIVVVGDWAKVGQDLGKLGLPIVRYDADGKKL